MPEEKMIRARLTEMCGADCVQQDVPMSEHTTFRTGGSADFFVTPKDKDEIVSLLRYLRQSGTEHLILGRGSNLLVGDNGYRGVVVDTRTALGDIEIEEDIVSAGAGAVLGAVAGMAAEASLAGMEFASGIPGSIGGAVFMNAGAYGGEMAQIVSTVELMNADGELVDVKGSDMGFSYRMSRAQKEDLPVISVKLKLRKGKRDEILNRIRDLGEQRLAKQPLEYPSAGSTFKRPEGYFAGKLISDAGLSGLSIGGAMVSPKHNGFIINTGNARSKEILDLIHEVQDKVKETSGVDLIPEVRIIGEF